MNNDRPDIKNLFKTLNQKHFGNKINDIPVLWNNRMRTTAGRCVYARKRINGLVDYIPTKIEMSDKLFRNNNYDIEKITRTLTHEMVHAYLVQEFNERGHTAMFHRMMTNITGEVINHRCHNYNVDGLRNKHRYEAICPVHGSIGTRNKRPMINRVYKCTQCNSVVEFKDMKSNNNNNNFWSI